MELLMIESVANVGERGDLVRVADGFARNYLLPKKLAVPASEANRRQLERERKRQSEQQERQLHEAHALAARLKELSLTLVRKAAENEVLYGSVHATDVVKALKGEGIDLDRRAVMLAEPIKTLGVYTVPIRLHPSVSTEVKLWVVRE
jgi:large subunit ribosomal protein L9